MTRTHHHRHHHLDIEKETDVLSDIANFFGIKPKDMSPSKIMVKAAEKIDKKKKKEHKKHHHHLS